MAGSILAIIGLVFWTGLKPITASHICANLFPIHCESVRGCQLDGDACLDEDEFCGRRPTYQQCWLFDATCMWDEARSVCTRRIEESNNDVVILDDTPRQLVVKSPTARPSYTRYPTASRLSTKVPSSAPTHKSENPQDQTPSSTPTFSPFTLNEDLGKLLSLNQLTSASCSFSDAECPGHLVCFRNYTWWLDAELKASGSGFCGCARSLDRVLAVDNSSIIQSCEVVHPSMWIGMLFRMAMILGELGISAFCIFLFRRQINAGSLTRLLSTAIGHALLSLFASAILAVVWKILEILCVHVPDNLFVVFVDGSKGCTYNTAIIALGFVTILLTIVALSNLMADWWYILNGFNDDQASYTLTSYLTVMVIFVSLCVSFPAYRYLGLLVFIPPLVFALTFLVCRRVSPWTVVDDAAVRSARWTACRMCIDVLLLGIFGAAGVVAIVYVGSLDYEQDFSRRPGLGLLLLCELLFFGMRVDLTVAAYRIHRHLMHHRAKQDQGTMVSSDPSDVPKKGWI